MNLLFLTYQGDLAGSTYSIATLAKGLAERGHRVVVGCRRELLLYELLNETAVIRLPMVFRSKVDRACMQQIADIVRQYNIELINAQSSKDRYLSIFARWRHGLKVKVVHTRRQKPESSGGRLQTWFYHRFTDQLIVISEGLKKTFVQKGFPAAHLTVVHNGMDTSLFSQPLEEQKVAALRRQLHLSATDVVVGCVARRKEQVQLLQAATLLPSEVKLLFVGVEQSAFAEAVQQLSLQDRVRFVGTVSQADLPLYYALMSVHVLPSTMDGFGRVLVEAMAAGVPVVATRAQGLVDVVGAEEECGLLFEDGEVKQLREQINRLLSDETMRQHYIEQGKKRAAHFTVERMVERYEVVFQQLIERGLV